MQENEFFGENVMLISTSVEARVEKNYRREAPENFEVLTRDFFLHRAGCNVQLGEKFWLHR
uniref:Uncharacterized protein n=1 Tax=Romanomermis culicivorax TaxID=13658 RepID=A0A915I7E8_ROMCU